MKGEITAKKLIFDTVITVRAILYYYLVLSGDILGTWCKSASNEVTKISEVKVKRKCIAVNGIPSHSYGVSLAIWDHTVLPATRHK